MTIHRSGRQRVRKGSAIGWKWTYTTLSAPMWRNSPPRVIILCGRFCAKLQLGVSLPSTSDFFVAHIWPHLADGQQAVYDQVIDELKKPALKPEITFQLLYNTVNILGRVHQANLQLSPSIEICPLVADLRRSNERHYQETAQQFVEHFTDRK